MLPCKVDAILPMSESGPNVLNMSAMMTRDAEPLIGLSMAIGIIFSGIFEPRCGVKKANMVSRMLLFRKMFTANIMLIVNGNMFILDCIPSLAPSMNDA